MAKVIKVEPIKSVLGKAMEVPELSPVGDPVLVDNPDGVVGMDGKILQLPKMVAADSVGIITMLVRLFPRNRLTMKDILLALKVRERVEVVKDGCFTLEDAEYEWLMKCLKDDGIGVVLFGFDIVNVLKAFEVKDGEKKG